MRRRGGGVIRETNDGCTPTRRHLGASSSGRQRLVTGDITHSNVQNVGASSREGKLTIPTWRPRGYHTHTHAWWRKHTACKLQYSGALCSSWEPKIFSAVSYIHDVIQTPTVHHRIHKSTPLIHHIPSQADPAQAWRPVQLSFVPQPSLDRILVLLLLTSQQ
jgi:hypothetical protein